VFHALFQLGEMLAVRHKSPPLSHSLHDNLAAFGSLSLRDLLSVNGA
jgi:hypothetical protein